MATEDIDYERGPILREGFTISGVEITPDDIWGGLAVLPVFLLYLIIALIPIAFAIIASFHAIPLTSPTWTFVGIENYVNVVQIDRFWASLWRGVIFMTGSTLLQTAVGIWMALVLNRGLRGEKVLSTLVFTAYLTPTIIVTLVGLFLFDPFVGLLHTIGLELNFWEGYVFGSQTWAMPMVILIGSWKFSSFITLFALAQLRSIPDRFYEAAKMAGATTWEMFRDITYPRIRGALLVAVMLRGIFMFNKYDLIWQLTQGGPGYATTTLPILAYRETFQGSAYGFGNAIAVVMFLTLAIGGVAYLLALNPSEEVET